MILIEMQKSCLTLTPKMSGECFVSLMHFDSEPLNYTYYFQIIALMRLYFRDISIEVNSFYSNKHCNYRIFIKTLTLT